MASVTVAAAVFVMTGTAGAAEPFPPFTQPVVDAAGVVASVTEQQVGAELIDYRTRSGNQIAVVVVDSTGSQSIEDYTIDLARAWGVGQKGTDNGILLLIAYRDRKLRIEVGRGLEDELTDLQSGRIIRERLIPLLKRDDVTAAVLQGTRAIRVELGDTQVGDLPPALGAGKNGGGSFGRWLSIAFVLVFSALALVGRGRRGGRGGRGGLGDALLWGAALGGLGGHGGHGGRGGFGGGGFGGGGGGGFGGGGASGDW